VILSGPRDVPTNRLQIYFLFFTKSFVDCVKGISLLVSIVTSQSYRHVLSRITNFPQVFLPSALAECYVPNHYSFPGISCIWLATGDFFHIPIPICLCLLGDLSHCTNSLRACTLYWIPPIETRAEMARMKGKQ
jgi:hypothetical protein